MAPQSKSGKGPQNKMAKAMAAKSKAQQQAKVKTEKATPKRKAKAAKTEVEQEEGEPTVPSSLGFARGSISAALTGLRYQLKAKKTSDDDKEAGRKVLEDRLQHALFRGSCFDLLVFLLLLLLGRSTRPGTSRQRE